MKPKLSIFSLIIFLSISLASHAEVKQHISFFNSNDYILTDYAKKELDEFISSINTYRLESISIVGHADDPISQSENYDLSKRRAQVVYMYLDQNGMPSYLMSTFHYGNSKKIIGDPYTNNKRVEVFAKMYTGRITDPLISLKEAAEYFPINNLQATQIKGRKGTIVNIPPKAFETSEGYPVSSKITLVLKELQDKSDFILESHEEVIDNETETLSKVYLAAVSRGKTLQLRKGKRIEITFKEKNIIQGASIYKGVQKNGKIEWVNISEVVHSFKKESKHKRYIGAFDGRSNSPSKEKKSKTTKVETVFDDLGWYKMAKPMKNASSVDLKVKAHPQLKMQVFLVSEGCNKVFQPTSALGGNYIFSDIPVSGNLKVVAFSEVDDIVYYSTKVLPMNDIKDIILNPIKLNGPNTLVQQIKKGLE